MSIRRRLPLICCALLAAGAPALARGATPIRLQIGGELPFTADELEQAAGARLTMSTEPGAAVVVVGPADGTGIEIRMGDRQAVVDVGARAGLAAARIVALAIAELVAEAPDAASTPQPTPATPAAPARPPPESAPRTAPLAIAAPATPPAASLPPGPPVRISVAIGGSKGMDASEPLTWTCEADAAFPLRRFEVMAGLGVWDTPTQHAGQADEASFVALVVRAGAGWRTGPVQLLLGAFAAPYRLEGGVHNTGVLAGGGTMLRVGRRLAAAPKVQVFGSLRIDAFANRISVSVPGFEPSFASPRLAAAVGIGIAWDPGS